MAASHRASLVPQRGPIKDWNQKTPEQQAELDRVLAICRKHTEKKPSPSSAVAEGETAKAILDQLEWKQVSAHLMQSKCKRYQVMKTTVGGHMLHHGGQTFSRTGYQPYYLVKQLWYIQLGPWKPTFEEAKEACEGHLREQK